MSVKINGEKVTIEISVADYKQLCLLIDLTSNEYMSSPQHAEFQHFVAEYLTWKEGEV